MKPAPERKRACGRQEPGGHGTSFAKLSGKPGRNRKQKGILVSAFFRFTVPCTTARLRLTDLGTPKYFTT